jgi:hypothetical protein
MPYGTRGKAPAPCFPQEFFSEHHSRTSQATMWDVIRKSGELGMSRGTCRSHKNIAVKVS